MPQDRSSDTHFSILYVEDNPGDVYLVRTALRECCANVDFATVDNGEDALHYLRRQGRYVQARRPDLILLDLNLPRKSGEEVLVDVKSDLALKTIPVVVFSSAASEVVCQPVYQGYANTCIRKPSEADGFLRVMRQTYEYWFQIACLPGQ